MRNHEARFLHGVVTPLREKTGGFAQPNATECDDRLQKLALITVVG